MLGKITWLCAPKFTIFLEYENVSMFLFFIKRYKKKWKKNTCFQIYDIFRRLSLGYFIKQKSIFSEEWLYNHSKYLKWICYRMSTNLKMTWQNCSFGRFRRCILWCSEKKHQFLIDRLLYIIAIKRFENEVFIRIFLRKVNSLSMPT